MKKIIILGGVMILAVISFMFYLVYSLNNSDLSTSEYEVEVVFSDEPDAIYIYQIFNETIQKNPFPKNSRERVLNFAKS